MPYDCNFKGQVGINVINPNNFGIKIYPNPSSDFLSIDFNYYDLSQAKITDLSGRELNTIPLEQNSKIKISDLSKRIYFLTISKDEEKIYTSKFIKE